MNFSQPGMIEHSDFCHESVNRSCPKITYPTAIRISLYIFCITIIVLTMCGNLLVIISITHFKQLHTPTNYLILSLAVTDFLLAIAIMPAGMVRMIETCWYFGDMLYRYYAVCQPLHYRTKITTCTAVTMILISWNLSFIIGFGMIFMKLNIWGIEDFYYNNFHCFGGCFIFMSKTAAIIGSLLSFYIPGFIMVTIYQKILHIALKQARSIHSTACQHIQTGHSTSSSKMEQKATKTLAIVMGVFLTCWLPIFVCNIIDPIINYSVPPVLYDVFFWIGYFNSTSNPMVYAFFYSRFRKAFKMIISGKIFQAHSSRSKLSTE
ncbi:trace amine-associated receptor 1-like [Conger conger]|uniref:trace amine-associated receptor 1-like n=1 Tax=Conger conger TaxID=82655 RepID=UPI002A5A5A3B|nr:trace amine-associated receptor 1-like [Conger conger]